MLLGDFRLDDVGGMDLAAVSFMPGAELLMPLQPNWRVSGFANFGAATEFETNSTAAIYRAGLSTRYRVASLRDPDLEFGFKLIHAGYGAAGEYGNPVNLASLGVTSSVALPWSVRTDQQTRLGVRWGYTQYFTAVRFRLPSIGYTEITNEWEAGLALVFRPGIRCLKRNERKTKLMARFNALRKGRLDPVVTWHGRPVTGCFARAKVDVPPHRVTDTGRLGIPPCNHGTGLFGFSPLCEVLGLDDSAARKRAEGDIYAAGFANFEIGAEASVHGRNSIGPPDI